MTKLKILIVDDEPDIRDLIICMISENYDADFFEFSNANETIGFLKEFIQRGEKPDLCISDMNMPNGNGLVLYQFIRTNLPNLPFILSTSDNWSNHKCFHGLYSGYIQKPFNDEEWATIINKFLIKEETIPQKSDDAYISLSLGILKTISKINCFLYLKVADSNYLKVCLPDTFFDEELVKKYQEKKETHLYVAKFDFKKLVHEFVENINTKILMQMSTTVSLDQIGLSSNVFAILKKAVTSFGWSEEVEKLAKQNILITFSYLASNEQIKQLFEDFKKAKTDYLLSHSLLISFITTAMLKESHWVDEAYLRLTMAAIFHDISLDIELCKNERKIESAINLKLPYNKEEQHIILSHPKLSLEIVNKLNYFPELAKIIIKQHHEKPDGSGYPSHLTTHELLPITAIFILAEELAILFLSKSNFAEIKADWMQLSSRYSDEKFKPYYNIILNWLKN